MAIVERLQGSQRRLAVSELSVPQRAGMNHHASWMVVKVKSTNLNNIILMIVTYACQVPTE
jgi:hypothetical protein